MPAFTNNYSRPRAYTLKRMVVDVSRFGGGVELKFAYHVGPADEVISMITSINQVRADWLLSDLPLREKARLLHLFKFAPSLRAELLYTAKRHPDLVRHLSHMLRLLDQARRVKDVQICSAHGYQHISIQTDEEYYRFAVNLFPSTESVVVQDLYPLVDIFSSGNYDYYPIGGSVVDIGGYIGDTAVYFCKKGARVVSVFEPNPYNYRFLLMNLSLNHVMSKVNPFMAAVTRSRGRSRLSFPRFTAGAGSLYERGEYDSSECEQIDVQTIDCNEVLGQHIDLLKLDCKGCEEDIVSECGENLKTNVAQVICEAAGIHLKIFVRELSELGFVIDKVDEFRGVGMVYARNPRVSCPKTNGDMNRRLA
jgi:FkbM family methyltransferase